VQGGGRGMCFMKRNQGAACPPARSFVPDVPKPPQELVTARAVLLPLRYAFGSTHTHTHTHTHAHTCTHEPMSTHTHTLTHTWRGGLGGVRDVYLCSGHCQPSGSWPDSVQRGENAGEEPKKRGACFAVFRTLRHKQPTP